jgi:hypothetical protein
LLIIKFVLSSLNKLYINKSLRINELEIGPSRLCVSFVESLKSPDLKHTRKMGL